MPFIKTLRVMFGVKITVLQAATLTELRVDHDCPLQKADFVLVYNQRELGHYSAACKQTFLRTVPKIWYEPDQHICPNPF